MAASAPVGENSIQVLLYPKNGPGSVESLIIQDSSNKKESKFIFNVEDLEIKSKGFSKVPAMGKLEVSKIDKRSFGFWIEKDGKPSMKCIVKKLPADISEVLKPKLDKGYITITVSKPKTVSFEDSNPRRYYPALIDME